MKILILGSKEYPFHSSYKHDKYAGGGIELYVEKLTRYITKKNHDVFIVTRAFPHQKKNEKNHKLMIFRTRFVYNKFLRNFTYNFFGFFNSVKIIRKFDIDLIHCNGPVSGFFGSILSFFTGKKLVFTPHGTITGWPFPIFQILKFFELISLRKAEKVIFVSEIAKNEVGGKVKKSSVLIPNAIDLEEFNDIKIDYRKKFVFGFIGRLDEIKGLKMLLTSYSEFIKNYPNSKLKIAGEGSLKKYVLNFIKREKLEDFIEYKGWVKDVPSFYFSIDSFVLPSSEKGQPFALLESMASGNIIITTLPYIKHMQNGVICKRNVKDLEEKMEYVYLNKNKLHFLGRNAQNEIRKEFSWDNRITKILNVYSELL